MRLLFHCLQSSIRRDHISSDDSNSITGRHSKHHANYKNALDGISGSLQAVVDFLAHHGVSKARYIQKLSLKCVYYHGAFVAHLVILSCLLLCSIRELEQGLSIAGDKVAVMERAQEYAECISVDNEADGIALVCLFTSSCEWLCRYQAVKYKQAYEALRRVREAERKSAAESDRVLQHQIQMAEEWCAAQKGLILAQNWGQRLLTTALQ